MGAAHDCEDKRLVSSEFTKISQTAEAARETRRGVGPRIGCSGTLNLGTWTAIKPINLARPPSSRRLISTHHVE